MPSLSCLLCRKDFKKISGFKMHYRNAHLQEDHECKICGLTFETFGSWNGHMAAKHSLGRGEKISKSLKNKLKSKEHVIKIGDALRGVSKSEAHRKKGKAAQRKYIKEHPEKIEFMKRIGKKGLKIMWLDKEFKERTSKRCVEQNRDPNCDFGYYQRKCFYNGIRMRSSWEVTFAELCDRNGLTWQYEPKTFKLDFGHRYTPDFYIEEFQIWIEVKPRNFHKAAWIIGKQFEYDTGRSFQVLDIAEFEEFFKRGC